MRRVLWVLALAACGKADGGPAPPGAAATKAGPPPGSEVSRLGSIEVTAKLADVRGEFPPNKLYDYVYVMKYAVLETHRGKVDGREILVGHYNPLKPRSAAADKFSGKIGGTVERFRVGDVHRLALEAPLDEKMPMVGLIDKYVGSKDARYWAVWADRASD